MPWLIVVTGYLKVYWQIDAFAGDCIDGDRTTPDIKSAVMVLVCGIKK